jgi:hypothetical protein
VHVGIALWLVASQSLGHASGAPGYSGITGVDCSSCHTPQAGSAPTVTITGPTSVVGGTTQRFTLHLQGGPGTYGGTDIAATDGGLRRVTSLLVENGADLVQPQPQVFHDGGCSWDFYFTAPDGAGAVTIYAAANSVNHDGTSNGDHSAKITYPVTITKPNSPPTLVMAADAGPSPSVGTTAVLTVLAADVDDGGEPSLRYTWTYATDAGTVALSAGNGTNAAKVTTATFTNAGTYAFTATVRDPQNAAVMSTTAVQINSRYSSVKVSPATSTLPVGTTLNLSALALDQFAHGMDAGTFTWSTDAGTITAAGHYTPPSTIGGPYLVTAHNGAYSGTAAITVAAGVPPHIATAPTATSSSPTTFALSVLGADDNPEAQLKYTWSVAGPAGSTTTFSANANNAAKQAVATVNKAGAYAFTVTVVDVAGLNVAANAAGSIAQAFTTLKVMPASATVPPLDMMPFSAMPQDQFGHAMTLGGTVQWLATGGGTVDATGVFHSSSGLGGPYEIRATQMGQVASALVTVSNGGAPFFPTTPTATPNVVTGRTTQLLAAAEDDLGESALSYHWEATGPAPVSFAPNDGHSARQATATFSEAGAYTLTVTATNATSKTATSQVDVDVQAVPDALSISPTFVALKAGAMQQFGASALDQFGTALPDTGHVAWTASGAGEIDGNGVLIARSSPGSFTVGATALGLQATAMVLIDTQAPTVTLAEPQAQSRLKGPTHLIATASDDFVVTAVRFSIDGKALGDPLTAPPFDVLWDTTGTPDGQHTLSIEAEDAAGNIGKSADIALTVWNNPNTLPPGPGVMSGGCSAPGAAVFVPLALAALLRRRRRSRKNTAVERSLS